MTSNTYVEEGEERDWNAVVDEDFDPNEDEYVAEESPIAQGGRGRGAHTRRGRGRGGAPGGRGYHPQGTVVPSRGRCRGSVLAPLLLHALSY